MTIKFYPVRLCFGALVLVVSCGRSQEHDVLRAVAAEVPGTKVQLSWSQGERRAVVSLNGNLYADSIALAPTAERVARRVLQSMAADSITDVGVLLWVGRGMPTPLGYRYAGAQLAALK